jgi:molybdopterin/thiamine biosynthesis adenylyltransferase
LNPDIWARQMAIPGVGAKGQQKLHESRAVVLGLGGVGGPAALYLAAAGIGSLVLVDGDRVEASNLNRQILFGFSDLGRSKAHLAAERLLSLNPDLKVKVVDTMVKECDLEPLLMGSQFVLDCFDKNADRLAVNRACVALGIPAAHGFAQDFSGEIFMAIPGSSSCLACAMDESFPELEVTPIMGVTAGMVAISMASAAILFLIGIADPVIGCRLIYDLAFTGITRVPVLKNPHCSACGSNKEG